MCQGGCRWCDAGLIPPELHRVGLFAHGLATGTTEVRPGVIPVSWGLP